MYVQEMAVLSEYFDGARLKVLDFGMGWGGWCRMANAFGHESYGMKLSEKRIEYATKHGVRLVQWQDLPDHDFDFINCKQVFEHINCYNRESLIRMAQHASLEDVRLPLRCYYDFVNWKSPVELLKSLVRPLKRRRVPRPNVVYLRTP